MPKPQVLGVRSVALAVSNLPVAVQFYTEVWGLTPVHAADAAAYLAGTSPYHHILSLHQSNGPTSIRHIVFDAANRDMVDGIYEIASRLLPALHRPRALKSPGGGYGFVFKDVEGRNFGVVCDVADDASRPGPAADRPHKISHVNLNSANWEKASQCLQETLGFRVIDETPALVFLNCRNRDHHSAVLCKSTAPTINHIAFEMPDLDSVMRGAGRMRDNGYPIEWGVGRHGAGNNVFAYFAGPDEFPLEYTAEVLQLDESYQPRGPDYWRFPPGRTDQWGVTAPPTARLKRIQQLFRFTDDVEQLD